MEAILQDLGRMTDREVAEKHNVLIQEVFQLRKKNNIPAFRLHKKTEKTINYIKDNLDKADSEIARELGFTRQYIHLLRQRIKTAGGKIVRNKAV